MRGRLYRYEVSVGVTWGPSSVTVTTNARQRVENATRDVAGSISQSERLRMYPASPLEGHS